MDETEEEQLTKLLNTAIDAASDFIFSAVEHELTIDLQDGKLDGVGLNAAPSYVRRITDNFILTLNGITERAISKANANTGLREENLDD